MFMNQSSVILQDSDYEPELSLILWRDLVLKQATSAVFMSDFHIGFQSYVFRPSVPVRAFAQSYDSKHLQLNVPQLVQFFRWKL